MILKHRYRVCFGLPRDVEDSNPQSDPLIDVAYRNGNKLSDQLHSLLDNAKHDNPVPTYHASIDLNVLDEWVFGETIRSKYLHKKVEINVTCLLG